MAENENEEIVGEVAKNATKLVRVYVSDYLGRSYVAARIFAQDGSEMPSHPGLTLSPRSLEELLPVLRQALDVCKARRQVAREPEPRVEPPGWKQHDPKPRNRRTRGKVRADREREEW
jgi:hypothetical protein